MGLTSSIIKYIKQIITEIEVNQKDLKNKLEGFCIKSAEEIDVSPTQRVILIKVPCRIAKKIQAIQPQLNVEIQQRISTCDVIIVADYRIKQKIKSGSIQQRPMSRTLTAVHKAFLTDIVYPSEIVGKKTRYRQDGTKSTVVYLDSKNQDNNQNKLIVFRHTYKKLTGKDVMFEYSTITH